MIKRREVIIILIVIGILLAALVGLYLAVFWIPTTTLNFKESKKIVDNPSRGFYIQIDSKEKERIKGIRDSGVRLVLIAFDIKDYLEGPIEEEKLAELKQALEEAKKYDIKVVFRAAYGFSGNYKDPVSLDIIEEHIKQVATILNPYKDTLFCVQAGFLGPWGEWHGSEFLDVSEVEKVDVRNRILKSLLDNLDRDIIINVRRPKFIRAAKEAGLEAERIGFHNDGLLSSLDDLGTYDEIGYLREDELDWVDTMIQTGINGGEMPMLSDYTDINNAVAEFDKLHISYLNLMYNQEVLEQWKKQTYEGENAYNYINNHLGYRYSINHTKLPIYLKKMSTIHLEGEIVNSGFATPNDKYQFYIVLNKDNDSYIQKVKIVSQTKEKIKFKINFKIPKELEQANEGEVLKIGIMLTDNLSQKNTTSAVEFANLETEFKNGVNLFGEYRYYKKKYVLNSILNK